MNAIQWTARHAVNPIKWAALPQPAPRPTSKYADPIMRLLRKRQVAMSAMDIAKSLKGGEDAIRNALKGLHADGRVERLEGGMGRNGQPVALWWAGR